LKSATRWKFARSRTELAEALAVTFEHKPLSGIGLSPVKTTPRGRVLDATLELLSPKRDRTSSFSARVLSEALSEPSAEATRAVLSYLAGWANRSGASVAAGREENRRRELLKQ